MKHEIKTKDHAGRVLEFTWDDETGEITGDETGDLESALKAAEASGKVEWPSWDQWIEVTDPRRSQRDMALVLAGMGFEVPESFLGFLTIHSRVIGDFKDEADLN